MWIAELKRTLQFFLSTGAVIGLLLSFNLVPIRAQSLDATADLAARINHERTSRGMIPYALNAQLHAAAQTHASDIARTGVNSHTGSDGSTVRDRVARAGYGSYSWGIRVGENWAFYPDAMTAMQMWMNSAQHTQNILHSVYREFGIGIAQAKNGATIYVVDFGAQPNVLPVFIQMEGRDISSGRIALALSNENYATSGDGAGTIGLAKEVEISISPDFAGAQWQPYAPRFAWPMSNRSNTVYVKFRDGRGRTTTSSDSINSNAVATMVPTAKPSATNTPRPRSTPTRSALPTLTAVLERTETSSPTLFAALEASVTPDTQIAMVETPIPLPPDSAESVDPREENQWNPVALGVFGLSVMLGTLAAVKYIGRHVNK